MCVQDIASKSSEGLLLTECQFIKGSGYFSQLTQLYIWVSFSRSRSEAIDTLYDPYLHFCYELALETSAKYSSIKSLRFMTSAMPIH